MSAPVVDPTTTAPQPPTALTAELGDTTTTLTWTASATTELTGYRLWVDTDEPVDLLGDTTTHDLADLDTGQHLVQLATVTADGVSAAITYSFAVPYPETPSRPPTALSAAPAPTAPTDETTSVPAPPSIAPAPAPVVEPPPLSSAVRRVISVELELQQVVVYDMTLGETSDGLCEAGGRDGYDDIGLGASLTARGASGDIIGISTLTGTRFVELSTDALYRGPTSPDDITTPIDESEPHDFMRGTCVFSGAVEVPTNDFYTVEINHRGEIPVCESDLEAKSGIVSTTLG